MGVMMLVFIGRLWGLAMRLLERITSELAAELHAACPRAAHNLQGDGATRVIRRYYDLRVIEHTARPLRS